MVMRRPASLDSPARHGLTIRQPEQGYRFSIDALLLADFARLPDGAAVADLGTGCGVIPLLLARREPTATFVGFESNPGMAALARENAAANGFGDRIEVTADDVLEVRSHYPVSSFDVVVSNPPFRSSRSGRISPHPGRDAARHETTAGIGEFLSAAKYLVKPSGRIFFIHHPSRLAEFVHSAAKLKLSILRMRMVHGTLQAVAKMLLVELAKGSRADVTVEAPLIVYGEDGEYIGEVARILGN
jgi:tRNA1Val (adenine37-N6)-methyltransferase